MAGVALRPEPADGATGAALLAEYYAEVEARHPGWSPGDGPSASARETSPPGGLFVVAYVDGRPGGCGALKRIDDATGEIKRMYVRPPARGRGVARALLAALEEAAREIGYDRVVLDTTGRMPEAEALYRSCGYTAIADYNGNPWAARWFERRLA